MSSLLPEPLAVFTTLPDRPAAERLARRLVEQRLAACVQVHGPLASCYRWQGTVEMAEEWGATIKTTRAAYPQVEQAIRADHPYEEPEIIALPIVTGSPGYLAWLNDQVLPPPEQLP